MIPAQLLRVGYFMAREGVDPTPKAAGPDQEHVEIITSGAVSFDPGDGPRYCGVGSIFRHREGEHTIWKSQPGHPYHCLVMLFTVTGPRVAPRLTSWNRPETLPLFVKDLLRAAGQPESDLTVLGDYAYATLNWHAWHSRRATPALPLPLRQALEFIKGNLDRNPAVEEIAAAAGLSRPYFQSLFHRHLQQTPHQYLLRQRLQRAGDLLAASDLPIKEIALGCGFDNLESFYRAFRKYGHDSPANYRRNHSPTYWK